jgi:hypothetical protein
MMCAFNVDQSMGIRLYGVFVYRIEATPETARQIVDKRIILGGEEGGG